MNTPPGFFAPGNPPQHQQPSLQQQRFIPRSAPQADRRRPQDSANSNPARRVPWQASPPPHAGPAPDERRQPQAPPATSLGPQPPSGPQHAGNTPRPQSSWSEPPARPNTAPPGEPAIEQHNPGEDTADGGQTTVLSATDLARVHNQVGHDQGINDFFADMPPTEAPLRGPDPDSHHRPFDGPPGTPDMFGATSYGVPDEHRRIVTSRRRPVGTGWRRLVSKATFGLITPGLSAKQELAEKLIRRIKAALGDVYVVAFVNAKGGVGKTTMTVAAGSAIARERGDRVIAVDVDTDLGDLSSRFEQRGGPKANIEALSLLQDASSYPTVSTFTVQNDDRLEMLASQNDPRSSYTLSSHDFEKTMKILRLHYNVILLDCGTAITSPLFSTIANQVDSLVVVASQDPPGLNGAWETLAWLNAHGFSRLQPRTVVAINTPSKGKVLVDIDQAEMHFRAQIPGVSVIRIPRDVHLAEGCDISFTRLKPRTRKALTGLAAAVAKHYPVRQPHRHRANETGGF
jgi:MinD-like ATPase involved in chromosome partitioning or flagellar assembly